MGSAFQIPPCRARCDRADSVPGERAATADGPADARAGTGTGGRRQSPPCRSACARIGGAVRGHGTRGRATAATARETADETAGEKAITISRWIGAAGRFVEAKMSRPQPVYSNWYKQFMTEAGVEVRSHKGEKPPPGPAMDLKNMRENG